MNHFLAMTMTTVGLALAIPASAESIIRVQVDSASLVEVPGEAKTLFVGNPAIADVTPISSRSLFVLGRRPGVSNLIILGPEGNEILNASLIVTPQTTNALTLHRGIKESSYNCTPRCIEGGSEAGFAPAAAGGAPIAAAGARTGGMTTGNATTGGATAPAEAKPGTEAKPGAEGTPAR